MIEKDIILAYALENAIAHDGKAVAAAVLPKLFQVGLKKNSIKDVMPEIKKIVEGVNKLSLKEQEEKFSDLKKILPKKEDREREGLEPLPNVKLGNVVVRFEPSPSGPLHIGHSLVVLLNYLYKKKYGGKFILRYSDTNPETIDKDAYKLILDDTNFLTNKGIDESVYQSDRLQLYYENALNLIKKRFAYVCTCNPESFKTYVDTGRACPCRNLSVREHLKRWKAMFSEYKEGDAVLRIKTDLKAKNPALREWPAFRICETSHPRKGTKFRVWPLMNFAVAIDDIDEGITHVIKGKDHIVNTERQKFIYDYLKVKQPVFIHIGKINFTGMKIKTREISQSIKDKQYKGWDDIRLPFIQSFKKRGFKPEAFHKFVENIGLSLVDKNISKEELMKLLDAFNKPLIEGSSRYFFIHDPAEITIKNAPAKEAKLPLHPKLDKGFRKFNTSDKFYIEKDDYLNMKEGNYRLMNLLNFKKNDHIVFISEEFDPKLETKMMHWLPFQKLPKIKILLEDGEYLEGISEPDIEKLKEGDEIQFERFGFCNLVNKEKLEFWFTQK